MREKRVRTASVSDPDTLFTDPDWFYNADLDPVKKNICSKTIKKCWDIFFQQKYKCFIKQQICLHLIDLNTDPPRSGSETLLTTSRPYLGCCHHDNAMAVRRVSVGECVPHESLQKIHAKNVLFRIFLQ